MAAEGKDSSLPIIMDHFERSVPPSTVSQNSSQPSPLQNLPQVIQDPLNIVVQEFLKFQRTSEELNIKVNVLSKEVEDLKRQLAVEKSEKEAFQEKYEALLLKGREDATIQASPGSSSRLTHPQSLRLKSDSETRSTHVGYEEEGSLQADAGIPKEWNPSLISDRYDGIVRTGEKFMEQEVNSGAGTANPVRKPTPDDDDAFSFDDETMPKVKVTTNHLEFMATGLDMYNWQTYMRALGLFDRDLEDIRYNYRDNAYEQRYQALLFWRNKSGLEASPESLVNAALRRNQRLLAEKFCRKFKGFEHLLKKDTDKKKSKKPDASPQADAQESEMTKGMSRMSIGSPGDSSVSFFTEEQVCSPTPGDQAIPTTPPHSYPHSNLHKSPSSPVITSPAAPSIQPQKTQSVSPLFVLIRLYMRNPDDGMRMLNDIFQMPFVGAQLQIFIKNLLKHHDEEDFKNMIREKLPQCKDWLRVCESWAECVTKCVVKWKNRPPIFLWNFCHALHSSGFTKIYEKFRKYLKPGSVGPSLPHTESLSDTKWSLLNDVSVRLVQQVSGASDWRKIAEVLGCNKEIPIWEQGGNGGKNVMQVYKTRGKTVGDLYEMLYNMNRNDIVKCMEDLQYTLPLVERN